MRRSMRAAMPFLENPAPGPSCWQQSGDCSSDARHANRLVFFILDVAFAPAARTVVCGVSAFRERSRRRHDRRGETSSSFSLRISGRHRQDRRNRAAWLEPFEVSGRQCRNPRTDRIARSRTFRAIGQAPTSADGGRSDRERCRARWMDCAQHPPCGADNSKIAASLSAVPF